MIVTDMAHDNLLQQSDKKQPSRFIDQQIINPTNPKLHFM